MAEGATLGGDVGFTLGGSYTDADGDQQDTGGTLGQAPYIAQTISMAGESRDSISLSGTFDG